MVRRHGYEFGFRFQGVSGFSGSAMGKKKAPQAGLFDFIFKPVEQQNALAPLRLTAKVKAKPKIVRIQVHLDFNYAANLGVKTLRRKWGGVFSVFFILRVCSNAIP